VEELARLGEQVAKDLRVLPSDHRRESPEPSFEPSPEPAHDQGEVQLPSSLLNAASQVLQSQDELMNVIINLDAQRESNPSDCARRASAEDSAPLSAVDELKAFDISEEQWQEYRAQLVESGYSTAQIDTMEKEIHAVRAMVHELYDKQLRLNTRLRTLVKQSETRAKPPKVRIFRPTRSSSRSYLGSSTTLAESTRVQPVATHTPARGEQHVIRAAHERGEEPSSGTARVMSAGSGGGAVTSSTKLGAHVIKSNQVREVVQSHQERTHQQIHPEGEPRGDEARNLDALTQGRSACGQATDGQGTDAQGTRLLHHADAEALMQVKKDLLQLSSVSPSATSPAPADTHTHEKESLVDKGPNPLKHFFHNLPRGLSRLLAAPQGSQQALPAKSHHTLKDKAKGEGLGDLCEHHGSDWGSRMLECRVNEGRDRENNFAEAWQLVSPKNPEKEVGKAWSEFVRAYDHPAEKRHAYADIGVPRGLSEVFL